MARRDESIDWYVGRKHRRMLVKLTGATPGRKKNPELNNDILASAITEESWIKRKYYPPKKSTISLHNCSNVIYAVISGFFKLISAATNAANERQYLIKKVRVI